MVDAQSPTGTGSWCLGRKAAAPLVSACPLLSSPFSPWDPPPPSPGSPEPSPRGGIPPAVPPHTHLVGEGEGSRPRQAWGEIPHPLPLGPSLLISQRRPPAALRAWGEASAGAWEGGGGGLRRRWVVAGGPERPRPAQIPCPLVQPSHSSPNPHQAVHPRRTGSGLVSNTPAPNMGDAGRILERPLMVMRPVETSQLVPHTEALGSGSRWCPGKHSKEMGLLRLEAGA